MKALSISVLVSLFALAATPMPDAGAVVATPANSLAGMQDPQEEEPKPATCPKKKSVILPGSPVSVSSAPTTTCDDGTSCGYTRTYNPPSTQCAATTLKLCCVEQLQRAYTQTFSCQPSAQHPNPTICVGGAKNPFGSTHVVFVTVKCNEETNECKEPGEY